MPIKMRKFTKTAENFTCGHCGMKIKGTGYTNHCPNCLYSKHVDVNPGDRQESCGGMMEPISFEIKKGAYILIHECLKCNAVKRNKMQAYDNLNILPKLSERVAKKIFFWYIIEAIQPFNGFVAQPCPAPIPISNNSGFSHLCTNEHYQQKDILGELVRGEVRASRLFTPAHEGQLAQW